MALQNIMPWPGKYGPGKPWVLIWPSSSLFVYIACQVNKCWKSHHGPSDINHITIGLIKNQTHMTDNWEETHCQSDCEHAKCSRNRFKNNSRARAGQTHDCKNSAEFFVGSIAHHWFRITLCCNAVHACFKTCIENRLIGLALFETFVTCIVVTFFVIKYQLIFPTILEKTESPNKTTDSGWLSFFELALWYDQLEYDMTNRFLGGKSLWEIKYTKYSSKLQNSHKMKHFVVAPIWLHPIAKSYFKNPPFQGK